TITGTNDGPVLSADSLANHPITEQSAHTGSNTADTASTTLAFTDVDLTDTHTVGSALASAVWSNGTVPQATHDALAAVLAITLSPHDSSGTGSGSVDVGFSVADHFFD